MTEAYGINRSLCLEENSVVHYFSSRWDGKLEGSNVTTLKKYQPSVQIIELISKTYTHVVDTALFLMCGRQ